MAALLDVSGLIALVDPHHVDHEEMQSWFLKHHESGWATCPLTENGMVRILSQPTYPSGKRAPSEVIEILHALKEAFSESHEFWPDDISLCDETLLERSFIVGSRQVTDVYLLALAQRHKGTFVSFDRSLSWQTIKGASAKLVRHPNAAH